MGRVFGIGDDVAFGFYTTLETHGAPLTGGVACNAGLRAAAAAHLPCPSYFPEPDLSTDNPAMIATAALPKFERGEFAHASLRAHVNLALV